MDKFADSPVCQSRSNCFQCRNNEKFREQMESQFGKIECPEGFLIGAKLIDLPRKSQDAYAKMQEMQLKRQQQIDEVDSILNELEIISGDEGKKLVDRIRNIIAPNSKTAAKCRHGGKQIGEANQECCGGKEDRKPVFACGKHVITVERKCINCKDFESK